MFSPIGARIDGAKVTVVDISSIGARLEHGFPLNISAHVEVAFEFDAEGTVIAVPCEVVRCKLDKSIFKDRISYTSGVRFSEPDGTAVQELMNLVSHVVKEDLDARREYAKKRK
ncbi:MAG: PilZ domain-containing protein [Acidobacteria bacterium]|nr:PilZ domain-containing protein [Acidobacteriota bacterium]